MHATLPSNRVFFQVALCILLGVVICVFVIGLCVYIKMQKIKQHERVCRRLANDSDESIDTSSTKQKKKVETYDEALDCLQEMIDNNIQSSALFSSSYMDYLFNSLETMSKKELIHLVRMLQLQTKKTIRTSSLISQESDDRRSSTTKTSLADDRDNPLKKSEKTSRDTSCKTIACKDDESVSL
ncbi:unnamed protein product [Didymodactylos carnosus]|uniref:Uncharacterized protein n=1 Tax=Didymodactylos carnosus TaxID=1234261 RepID=A0A814B4P6_9BILA|nr:unnamed protein product [Didymodactylos carnosus]CAF3702211.1 unnamed protein product [Didymodactylos carnosus]